MLLDAHIMEAGVIDSVAFAARTGWESKPEGLCKGDLCVPAPDAVTDDGLLRLAVLSDKLGMAMVGDEATGAGALGPESGGKALSTARMPELTLPDFGGGADGNPFSLSSLHGRKVLLVAWASW